MKQAAVFLFLLFASFNLNAQDTLPKFKNKLPKIGLVLSGGGAKGFAHIGVLKVLEKAGIKVDYIAGTSMGSVVGALYASGYNATQIDSIFIATDFNNIVNDYVPRSSKNFNEKRNDETYAFTLPFDHFKVGVPLSLSKGMYNYNILNRLFQNVRGIEDYNKFSIPYLCMTTDIETGKEVVQNKGYLPLALLASSAFPTLFSPIEIDGKLLSDGGIANNYPVEKLREMGAEFIIGSDVQDDLRKREDLNEATKIMTQINNFQMLSHMDGKIQQTDIYIKPYIKDFSIVSFDKGREIIEEGEKAASLFLPDLMKLSSNLKPEDYPHQKTLTNCINLNEINFNDLESYTRAYIIGKLGFNQFQTITYDDLNIGIDKLNATQNFKSINYQLEKTVNNKENLILNIKENEIKNFLKFSLHYDVLYKSAILTNLTRKKSITKNDVVSLDLIFGDNFRYNLDYYIDNGFYTSFGIKSKLNKFNRNIATDFNNGQFFNLAGINSLNINYTDLVNQIYIQSVFKQKYSVRTGIEYRNINARSETLLSSNQTIDQSDFYSGFVNLKYDSLDDKYFPTKGFFICGDFQSYLTPTDFLEKINPFSVAKGELLVATHFLKKITFTLQSEIGFTVGNRNLPILNFVFGGYGFNSTSNVKPMYGYDFLSLSSNSFFKNTLALDYEFYKKHHFNIAMNQANIADNLFRNTVEISVPRYSGYAIGYGLQTLIGPIELKYSWSPETAKGFVWFNLGFGF